MRRHAWLNLDSFSTAWVTCWPSKDQYLSNSEFSEIAARYFGLPSPACEALYGESIAGTKQTLDRFGVRLGALPLLGDGWREQHDCLKWQIVQDAREMGVPVLPEVYGLFAACIPQRGRHRFNALPLRKRQGLVPDMRLTMQWQGSGPARDILLEVKTLHFAHTTYPTPVGAAARCHAVARRAAAIPGEYSTKARKVDRLYCGTAEGSTGPVEARLRNYDPVKSIVFGAFGEASKDVHDLLSALARAGAMRHHRDMLVCGPAEAIGPLAWLLKRRWGVLAARENARLLLSRLQFVGRGAAEAASRRSAAQSEAAKARRAACVDMRAPSLRRRW